MEPYEKIYQQLRARGEPAWTGEGYARAWTQLDETLSGLNLPAPGSPVLELGCGNGAMASQWFACRHYPVTGVDISPTAVRWATENFTSKGLRGHFLTGDVCHLPQLAAHRFALIYDGSCIHCLIGEQRAQAYTEIRRLLAPGGCFVLSSMCGEPGLEEDRQRYNAQQHRLYRNGLPWRTLKPLTLLRDELLANGFTIVHQQVNNNSWWDHATLCCELA